MNHRITIIIVVLILLVTGIVMIPDIRFNNSIKTMPRLWERNKKLFEGVADTLLSLEGLVCVEKTTYDPGFSDVSFYNGLRFRGKVNHDTLEIIHDIFYSLRSNIGLFEIVKYEEGYIGFLWRHFWWTSLWFVYDPRPDKSYSQYVLLHELANNWYIAKSS